MRRTLHVAPSALLTAVLAATLASAADYSEPGAAAKDAARASKEAMNAAKEDPAAAHDAAADAGPSAADLAATKKAHDALQPMVGTFDATVRMFMGPEPTESKGTSVSEWILGDRYLRQTFRSEMFGEPFEGLGFTTYDYVLGRYVGTWIDSMGVGIGWQEGRDGAGGTMTSTLTMTDAMRHETVKARTVTTVHGPDRHVWEMWMPGPDGKDSKVMEIDYRRRK